MKDEVFLKEKPVKTLVTIRRSRDEIYPSKVSKEVDTTYAHAVKVINQLEEDGLINSEKQGRKKILKLTDLGCEYADIFIEVLDILGQEQSAEVIGTEKRYDIGAGDY